MKRSQLAINSVSTRFTDLGEALQAYREAGFVNVEFCLPHVYEHLDKGHRAADVRRMLDDLGLRCIGGFEGTATCFGPAEPMKHDNDRIVQNARLLHELGGAGTKLVVGTDGPGDRNNLDDAVESMARTFGELARRVEEFGVTICIEFNWSPLVKSLRTAAQIAKLSGASNVGVLFDPAHYHCTPSKFEQLTPQNVRLIRHVHVDDMRDKSGELSDCNADRVLPGKGCLDLPALFGRIEQYGYDGFFSIEMFNAELWQLPVRQAAKAMYQSLLPLCRD